jgi:hypothetical protein
MVTAAAATPLTITSANDDVYSASGIRIPLSTLVAAKGEFP